MILPAMFENYVIKANYWTDDYDMADIEGYVFFRRKKKLLS